MIFEHENYRSFLRTVLNGKRTGNPHYSMRAFSDRIGVSSSFLSEVLAGKKSLSVDLAFRIGLRLDLTERESQYLCLLVQLEQEKDPEFREALQKRLKSANPRRRSHDLSVDLFKVVADWYHFAILELTFLPDFRFDAKFIADRLGITKAEADLAMERLERLELIERIERGKARKTHDHVLVRSAIPATALRQFHRQILEKAGAALETQTPKERVSATDFVPLDAKDIPEVDRLSQEFSAAVLRLSDRAKTRSHVYALSVHFFRISQERPAR